MRPQLLHDVSKLFFFYVFFEPSREVPFGGLFFFFFFDVFELFDFLMFFFFLFLCVFFPFFHFFIFVFSFFLKLFVVCVRVCVCFVLIFLIARHARDGRKKLKETPAPSKKTGKKSK